MGFFMNSELLPILTDYANKKKGGMKFIFLVMVAILDTGRR
jgi:hypothetical protein